MNNSFGIIGQGFVGSAVYNGMKDYFNILTYDINPNKYSNILSTLKMVLLVEVIFLCVPTPMYKDGSCDISIVTVALSLLLYICKDKNKEIIIVIKSTIPPGTTTNLNTKFLNLHIVFNPLFLTEANANYDFKNQNRIIIGGDRPYSTLIKKIYSKAFPTIPIIKTSSTIAELIKYVTNTFLSMKVSFANEIYGLCTVLNLDYDKVILYSLYDERLGQSH